MVGEATNGGVGAHFGGALVMRSLGAARSRRSGRYGGCRYGHAK